MRREAKHVRASANDGQRCAEDGGDDEQRKMAL